LPYSWQADGYVLMRVSRFGQSRAYPAVGELADRSGVTASALRFYERQGLIRSRGESSARFTTQARTYAAVRQAPN
jgi:MerR family regulatory protein